MSDNNEWKNFLQDEIADAWAANKQAYLLSRIPIALARAGFDLAEIRGKEALSSFLMRELDSVRLIKNDASPLVWGAVPANAQLNTPNSIHFGVGGALVGEVKRYLYARPVWNAFREALSPGTKRVLFLEPEHEFQDIPLDSAIPANAVAVEDSHISTGRPAVETQQVIENWLATHKLDRNSVLQRSRLRVTDRPAQGGASALTDLLELIDPADRTRVCVPLDIIFKLQATPSKKV